MASIMTTQNKEPVTEPLLGLLTKARMNTNLTDIVLICDGGQVGTHRIIIASGSEYFEKLFMRDSKESPIDHVDLHQISVDVMYVILDYIYLNSTEKIINDNVEFVLKVLQSSHLFKLKRLTDHCFGLLKELINIGNCIDIWNAVQAFGDAVFVVDYLLDNLQEIVSTNRLQDFKFSQLKRLVEELETTMTGIDEPFLERMITWNVHNPQQPIDIFRDLLLRLNYENISREFMTNLMETEGGLFSEDMFKKFFSLQILPKLKRKEETVNICLQKINYRLNKGKIELPLKLFYFCCYKTDWNGPLINENVSLRIVENIYNKDDARCISDLPFLVCGNDFIPIQFGSFLYIIGSIPATRVHLQNISNRSFLQYDWQVNKVTCQPSLPKNVKDPHICLLGKRIYVIESNTTSTLIQYFDTEKKEWKVIVCHVGRVIACVTLNGILYFASVSERKNHFLYAVVYDEARLRCSIPIPSVGDSWWNERHHEFVYAQKCLCAHNEKLLLFMFSKDEQYNMCWLYSPVTGECKLEKFDISFFSGKNALKSRSGLKEGVIVYEHVTRKLVMFNEIHGFKEHLLSSPEPQDMQNLEYSPLKKISFDKVLFYNDRVDI